MARELGRLGEAELASVLAYARLWSRRPRRWWWVQEGEGPFEGTHGNAWVIGGVKKR